MAQPSSPPPDIGEKASGTPRTMTTELDNPRSSQEEHQSTPHIEGTLPDLFYGAFLPCLPVVLVTTLLLTLIFYHRVDIDPGWELLQTPTTGNISDTSLLNVTAAGGTAAYYVRFNPALLATIAAWSSKLIPYFTGFLMTNVAFFAGRRILDATKSDQPGHLPTPHQASILVNLLSGAGTKPLWQTILYRWYNHEALVQPVTLAFWSLSSIFIITLIIGGADTWFAAATKPENVPILTRHSSPVSTFGRGLNTSICGDNIWEPRSCPSNSQSLCNYPCSIVGWNTTTGGGTFLKEGIKGAQQCAETLLGNSYTNIIQNTSFIANQQDYTAEQCFFLGDVDSGHTLDFLTSTIAVTTQCQVMTQDCQINTTSAGFSCPGYQSPSFTFSGEVGVDPTTAMVPGNMSMAGIQFFKDSGLQSPIGFGNQSTELFSAQNPMYFMGWSKGFPPVDTSTQTFARMTEGNYLQVDQSGDNVFILNCSSTIYNTTYAWVNGTVLQAQQKHGFYPNLAPDTYGALLSAPFAISSALSSLALQNAAALAAYKTTPQEVASTYADEFSRAAIALSAGVMIPMTNSIEQSRNNTELLTRVPKVPLYFLISLKALYALASLSLAVLAAFLTRPYEAQEVKARLTADGLAAGLFETRETQEKEVGELQQLFGEHRPENKEQGPIKVGMKETSAGGWMWVTSGKVRKGPHRVNTVVGDAPDSGQLGTAEKDHYTWGHNV